jgi:hypothetical protein
MSSTINTTGNYIIQATNSGSQIVLNSNTVSVTGNVYSGNLLANGYFFANGVPFVSGGATGATGPQGATGPTGSPGGATGATGTFAGDLTANINGQGYSISNVATITATGNVYSNGNIAMVSNLPRNTYVANVAPTSGQGNIGDIWYQTF